MKTYSTRPQDVERRWHVLDAAEQPLGRLATRAAHLLRGKHKPQFAPHLNIGDFVVVVNAEKAFVTGKKPEQKIYYRHSGYPGGLRQQTFDEVMRKNPRRAVEHAIRGMLPHTRLGRRIFTHLKVYSGPEHPHQAQIAGVEMSARPSRRDRRVAAAAPLMGVTTALTVPALALPSGTETETTVTTYAGVIPETAATEEHSDIMPTAPAAGPAQTATVIGSGTETGAP